MKHLVIAAAIAAIAPSTQSATMLVGWDGADYRVVKEMADAGQLPNLSSLKWDWLEITSVTQTSPSWQEQLSGLPWYVNGCIANAECRPLEAGKSIFDWARMYGLTSAFLTGKLAPMSVEPNGPFAHVSESADVTVLPDTNIEYFGDECLAAAATHDFTFCHSKHPDKAGHIFGGTSAKYHEKLIRLDVQLGRYLAAGHTVVLTSDHGFELGMQVGYEDPIFPARSQQYGHAHIREPNAIIGSNVDLDLYRPTQRDVFKTLVDVIGLPPAWWALEGRSLLKKAK